MAQFPFLQIYDVHQFDHMDCEFFQDSLWIAASGINSLLSYLKSSREILDSLPASDTEKHARDLDLKYQGSTSTKVLKSNGKDGRYLVLVVGPFANLSDDFMVLCD